MSNDEPLVALAAAEQIECQIHDDLVAKYPGCKNHGISSSCYTTNENPPQHVTLSHGDLRIWAKAIVRVFYF